MRGKTKEGGRVLKKFLAALVFLAIGIPTLCAPAHAFNEWVVNGTADTVAGTFTFSNIQPSADPFQTGIGRDEVVCSAGDRWRVVVTHVAGTEAIQVAEKVYQNSDPWTPRASAEGALQPGGKLIRTLECDADELAGAFGLGLGFETNSGKGVTLSYTSTKLAAVRVTSPDGGEILEPGQVEITWTADATVIGVNIDLISDGVPMARLATGVSGSSFVWELDPYWPAGSRYRVRVSDSARSGAFDDSNQDFSVSGESKIVVEHPLEPVVRGEQATLRWRYSGVSATTARVELWKGTARVAVLGRGVPFGTAFVWAVPADLAPGADYRLRVVAGGVKGRSRPFTIE